MATYYIGADVHSNNTELAIEQRGRIVARYSVPTTIPAISTVLSSLQGKKIFAMEEGPMAGWLYRNLNQEIEQFVVSEPRHNKLIAGEGDKDDKIDAGKLAILLRGNFLKSVHHTSDDHRAHLKHWINLYHDRIRDAVRDINKIRVCCRMHGVRILRKVVRNPVHRHQWLSGLDNPVLKAQLHMFWIGYDATKEQVELAKKQFSSYARKYPIIRCYQLKLATDGKLEYLSCTCIYPAPELREYAERRSRRGKSSKRWSDWETALATVENAALKGDCSSFTEQIMFNCFCYKALYKVQVSQSLLLAYCCGRFKR